MPCCTSDLRQIYLQCISFLIPNQAYRAEVLRLILFINSVYKHEEILKKVPELDIHVEHHSKYVFNEKRAKLKQTFNEVMNLYKQEKREDKIKELLEKMETYDAERARKIQLYSE